MRRSHGEDGEVEWREDPEWKETGWAEGVYFTFSVDALCSETLQLLFTFKPADEKVRWR